MDVKKENFLRHFILKGALLFLTATILGFFFATQSYLSYLYRDNQANFLLSLSVSLPDWIVWAIFTPLIVKLGRRFPFERQNWLKNGLVHLLTGLIVTLLKLFVLFQITSMINWLPSRPVSIFQFHPNFLTYLVIVGLSHAFDYYRKFRERELRNSQLETRFQKRLTIETKIAPETLEKHEKFKERYKKSCQKMHQAIFEPILSFKWKAPSQLNNERCKNRPDNPVRQRDT